jgi:hypothetical protein
MHSNEKRLNPDPVFLLGITHRCGTSMLYHLMERHPDIGLTPVTEDFLISESEDLVRFARRISKRWRPFWTEDRASEDVICEFLGKGLLHFLNSRIQKNGNNRLFTKSPTVRNLHLFPKFFPGHRVAILVRDGRSVTESLMKGMHTGFEEAVHRWAEGARVIREFMSGRDGSSGLYIIVKYEDLVMDRGKELRRIFTFFGLDPREYDFNAAENLPVYGSSFFKGDRPGPLHWEPVPKNADFHSLKRWNNWGSLRHRRFNRVAGKHMNFFGYALLHNGSAHAGNFILNLFQELMWQSERVVRFIRRVVS